MGRSFRKQRGLAEMLEQRVMLSAEPVVTSSPAGAYTVTFGTADDVVGVELISTEASDNSGVIVKITYIDDASVLTEFHLGNATTGVLSLTIDGGGGSDRFTVNALGKPLTIHGGAGTDSLIGPDDDTDWTISGLDTGSATGITLFDSVENLTGRSGVDEFTLATAGSITGQIDGGDGDDTLIGPDTLNVWTISGENSGEIRNVDESVITGAAAFIEIESITGGNVADEIRVLTEDSLTGVITGGAGIDWLIAADEDNTWTLTGSNTGTLNDSDFSDVEKLTGGNADDTLSIVGSTAQLSQLFDGGEINEDAPSVNTINFSQRGQAVFVDLETRTASALAMGYVNLTRFEGSNSADTLTGPIAVLDQTAWTISGTNSGTVDGAAFSGFESLNGQNSTRDAFTITASGNLTGTIHGGTGALDGFAVGDGAGNLTVFQPPSSDASGNTTSWRKVDQLYGNESFQPVERQ